MRRLAAATLLLAATAASGGPLIHFRMPDGRAGMVDDPAKLPPGALVVERREKTVRAEEPGEALAGEPAPERADEGAAGARPAGPSEPTPVRKSASAAPCLASGYGGDCVASEDEGPGPWCGRGQSARDRIERAEQAVERAEDELDDCETASLRRGSCTRRYLESAELELESAEEALSSLEDACHHAGCLPGWLRGDCGP